MAVNWWQHWLLGVAPEPWLGTSGGSQMMDGGTWLFRRSNLNKVPCIICSQEELNVALFHIKDVSSRQREVQKKVEELQLEKSKDTISAQHRWAWNPASNELFHVAPGWAAHGFIAPKIDLLLGKSSKRTCLLSEQEVLHSRRPHGAGGRAQTDRSRCHPAPPLQSAAGAHTEELHVYAKWAGHISRLLSTVLSHVLPHGLCCVHSASISEQDDPRSRPSKFPSWGERSSSRDADASSIETSRRKTIQMFPQLLWLFRCDCDLGFGALVHADKRQRVALELLESERVYVSHLSLLLKANISFNGSEAFTCKDKRWVCRRTDSTSAYSVFCIRKTKDAV